MSRADRDSQSSTDSTDIVQEDCFLPQRHRPGYTPIGVDVGEWYLAVAAPARGDPESALTVSGEQVRERYSALVEATDALETASIDSSRGQAQLFAATCESVLADIYAAADHVVEYAQRYPAPLLVLEDLQFSQSRLWDHRTSGELGAWLLRTVQLALEERAREVGLTIAYVDATNSTQECHRCGAIGAVDGETLECPSEDCDIDEVCRDRSAALTIAQRALDE